MKIQFLLPALFCCAVIHVTAQRPGSPIEIRLALIQQTGGDSAKGLAVGISIINHSDSDLYIPDFESIAALGGIHFYEQSSGDWVETDITTLRPMQTPHNTVRTTQGTVIDDMDVVVYKQNAISRNFASYTRGLKQHQDSLLRTWVKQIGQSARLRAFLNRQPVFLKAGETIRNYRVWTIDYFMKQQNDYKISFFLPPNRRQFASADPTVSTQYNLSFPEKIFSYFRYFPSAVEHNTLFYSTRVKEGAPPL